MLVVNLYGPPGSGKSTIQADVFRRLKQLGINAEIMTEFAKLLTYEDRSSALACQPYIFGKNLYEMTVLRDKVDVLILDSPLMLSVLYGPYSAIPHPQSFYDSVVDFSQQFRNLNYMLRRVFDYDPNGRRQNAEESDEVAVRCAEMLARYQITYSEIDGDDEAGEVIVRDVQWLLSRGSRS
jgi:nicotinamide riboside kinase